MKLRIAVDKIGIGRNQIVRDIWQLTTDHLFSMQIDVVLSHLTRK